MKCSFRMATGATSVPKALEERSDESSEDENLTEEEKSMYYHICYITCFSVLFEKFTQISFHHILHLYKCFHLAVNKNLNPVKN